MKKTLMLLVLVVISIACNRTPVIDISAEAAVIRKIHDNIKTYEKTSYFFIPDPDWF